MSNNGFADVNHVRGEISSASEVLYGLLDSDKIDRSIAVPIYAGMAHDTGVFQYSSTTPETMRIAGELMKTGFDFSRIIDESFYQKTYLQNQVMGRVLAESILLQGGKCVVGYLKNGRWISTVWKERIWRNREPAPSDCWCGGCDLYL